MKMLKQNHHGLPGIGVNGKIGEIGEKGNSIYFGFINDFFDGETINVSTYVYVAKRLLENNGNNLELIDLTLDTAWKVTLSEIATYDRNNNFKNFVESVTNNTSVSIVGTEHILPAPYVNYKTFYYTGNRLISPEMIVNVNEDNPTPIDTSTLLDASIIQLDITGDYISMSFMLSTLNGNTDNDIKKQFIYDADVTPSEDLQYDTSGRLDDLYQYINFSISHYEFENLAGLLLNVDSSFIQFNSRWTYDSNDAIYYANPLSGIDMEMGKFFTNDNSTYFDNIDGLAYVAENVNINHGITPIATDELNYFAEFKLNSSVYTFKGYSKQYLTKNTTPDPVKNWNMLYKISSASKINRLYPINVFYKEGDLYDYKYKAFYGIPPRILFKDRDDINVPTTIDVSSGYNNLSSYYSPDNVDLYADHVNTMITDKNGLHLFYSLDKDDTIIFIPFSLKNDYKPGDVIFFYTNKTTFENTYNIEYMTVITEDLLNCSPTKFINAAKLQNPLNINLFRKYKNRLNCFFNNAVLYDNNNINPEYRDSSLFNSQHLYDKTYVSIVDEYTKSPALLCSNNKIISFNIDSSTHSLNNELINNLFVLNTNIEIPLKIKHLCVNDSNMTNITNVELYKYVYDKNIKFYENKFIKPLVDIDLYYDNSNMGAAVFLNTILGDDYFYNIETLDNYFYGCNIYNANMEKIKTITSNEKSFDIEIVPDVNNNLFYILMFASYGSGSKYYSKLSKLTITYTTFLYSKNTRKMKLAYNSPIGKFSNLKKSLYNKSIGAYTERLQITSFTIEVIGDELSILRKKYANNIIFDISDITYELVNDASLKIYTDNDNIEILDVKFNQIEPVGHIQPNNWSCISVDESNMFKYKIDLSSNLPTYNNEDSSTLYEYLLKSGNNSSINYNSESLLFTNLLYGREVNNKTKLRSLIALVKYKFLDSSEYYYENYNIVQPGFEDTRDLPNVELNMYNNIIDLESINSITNNVLSNQFVTYLDIDISDFKKLWEKYINVSTNLNDIVFSCDICNLPYDLEWQENYFIKTLYNRRTFKPIYESSDVSTLNNYVKFNIDIDTNNTTLNSNQITIDTIKTIYDDTSISYLPHSIIDNNDEYILFDTSLNDKIKNKKEIYVGLLNDITISLKNISISNDSNNVRVKLSTEFGNPIISNMYYRFYVKRAKIDFKFNNSSENISYYTYVPDISTGTAGSTYLCVVNNSDSNITSVIDFKYKFISEPLDVTFSPLSYIICPNDIEKSYTNIYGDIYKYGIQELVIKELKFFNSSVYSSNEYVSDMYEIRKTAYYDYSNLNIKKSYLLDNVKNIFVKPIQLISDIYLRWKKSYKIDTQLYTHNVLDSIEGEKYLGLVYHSTIMQPRLRNDKYTFFYNDREFERTKYDQKLNNLPIFVHDEQSFELRDDNLINSMDKLNDWYAENETSISNKTYKGVLSLYGNGYTQITSDVSINNCMPLEDVIKLNDEIITSENSYNELDVYPMNENQPNHNEYFRGFLYDINWEYPYYDKNAIVPYRIVSAFDNVLKNTSINEVETDNDWYNSYYNALTDSSLYEDRMIPYTLLYSIEPRIAYNYDTKKLNVFMLRKPSINVDTDIIDGNSFKEKYEFNRRLFNLSSDPTKLTSPYTVK